MLCSMPSELTVSKMADQFSFMNQLTLPGKYAAFKGTRTRSLN